MQPRTIGVRQRVQTKFCLDIPALQRKFSVQQVFKTRDVIYNYTNFIFYFCYSRETVPFIVHTLITV